MLHFFSPTTAGAVDDDMFLKVFEEVAQVNYGTLKNLEHEMCLIRDTIGDSNVDWQKRIELMKRLRSFVCSGATEHKEFFDYLKGLEVPFQACVKDLRSQIVREACITISFLSQNLGLKFARFAELILPTLINLIPNSAKIMSSSALVTLRFILDNIKSPRLIPIVIYNLDSKSKEIRKACCEFLDQIVHTWPTSSLERHVGPLQTAIKKGISDADSEARQFARKAFWGFAEHFKEQSDLLINSLDANKQRTLYGEHISMSNASSTNYLVQVDSYPRQHPSLTTNRVLSVSSSNSVENLNRPYNCLAGASRYRSRIPIFSSPKLDYGMFGVYFLMILYNNYVI